MTSTEEKLLRFLSKMNAGETLLQELIAMTSFVFTVLLLGKSLIFAFYKMRKGAQSPPWLEFPEMLACSINPPPFLLYLLYLEPLEQYY